MQWGWELQVGDCYRQPPPSAGRPKRDTSNDPPPPARGPACFNPDPLLQGGVGGACGEGTK